MAQTMVNEDSPILRGILRDDLSYRKSRSPSLDLNRHSNAPHQGRTATLTSSPSIHIRCFVSFARQPETNFGKYRVSLAIVSVDSGVCVLVSLVCVCWCRLIQFSNCGNFVLIFVLFRLNKKCFCATTSLSLPDWIMGPNCSSQSLNFSLKFS